MYVLCVCNVQHVCVLLVLGDVKESKINKRKQNVVYARHTHTHAHAHTHTHTHSGTSTHCLKHVMRYNIMFRTNFSKLTDSS